MANSEKVTLTLPSDLMQTVREITPPRGQSKFISEAISYFIEMRQRQILRDELIAGYQATADEALTIMQEWEATDDVTWRDYLPAFSE